MKKLIYIAALLVASSAAFAQTYYYKNQQKNNVSFQVAPQAFQYGDYTMYGFSLGMNVKEVLNISYFHTRDYVSKETFMDTRWAGLHAGLMIPVTDKMDIGPSVRLATLDGEFEKMYYGAEVRFDVAWNTKLGLEYGRGKETVFGVKFIWNIY